MICCYASSTVLYLDTGGGSATLSVWILRSTPKSKILAQNVVKVCERKELTLTHHISIMSQNTKFKFATQIWKQKKINLAVNSS
jgi:hypothetical protein